MSVSALSRPFALAASGQVVEPWPAGTFRAILALLTLVACAGAGLIGLGSTLAGWEPDLVRLMRFMAALKGGCAVVACAAGFWRLARPVAPWRLVPYLAGPGAMAGGAILLWHLHAAGWAAIVLHAGLFGWLAAALTDPTFIPVPLRRSV